MRQRIFNERGIIFVEAMFLALIVSFTAIMIVNGLEVAVNSNRMAAVRNQAIHLATSQMDVIEEYIETHNAAPSPSYTLLTNDDLIYEDFFGINGTLKFEVKSNIKPETSNGFRKFTVKVKVSWLVNDNADYGTGDNYEEFTKEIWIKQNI